jgi:hypothetical protein
MPVGDSTRNTHSLNKSAALVRPASTRSKVQLELVPPLLFRVSSPPHLFWDPRNHNTWDSTTVAFRGNAHPLESQQQKLGNQKIVVLEFTANAFEPSI